MLESDDSDDDLALPNNAFSSPLQSPERPPQTRAGSPQLLALPTLGDNVDEELSQVSNTLRNIGHTSLFRKDQPEGAEAEEVVGFISGAPDQEVSADNNLEDDLANMPVVNFEDENSADTAGALVGKPPLRHLFHRFRSQRPSHRPDTVLSGPMVYQMW